MVGTAGVGDFLGEIGFLLGQPRSATARAGEDGASVTELHAHDFEALVGEAPELMLELSRQLSRRLAEAAQGVDRVTHFAVIAGDPKSTLAAIASAHTGRVGVCGGPQRLPGGLSRVRETAVIQHLRSGARSFRDLSMLVVCAGADRSIVADTAAPVADWTLAAGPPPAWLSALSKRPVVDTNDGVAMARALRWMTGRAVGIALSSGGSKTCAHIGVVAALADAGVPVDAVSGCSGGAAFAIAVAAGVGVDEMQVRAKDLGAILSGGRLDVLPRIASQKGQRVYEMFQQWWGDAALESLPIPAAVVATEIDSGICKTFTTSAIADAVRASMAIPGLLSPWQVEGKWFVDGAVVDPLPVASLRSMGVGTVVASNVAGRGNRAGRASAQADKPPGLMAIISSVLTASEAARVSFALASSDQVIAPDVDAANSFDFSDVAGFVEAGREAAERVLADDGIF